jgi:hypothetical protein
LLGARYGNVALTRNQLQRLQHVYGYDPRYGVQEQERSYDFAVTAYQVSLAAWNSTQHKHWETPPQPPNKAEFPEAAQLLDGGGVVYLGRDITSDGIRVMAFLSHWLEPGEDPVLLVARALAASGYDVAELPDLEAFYEDQEAPT